MEHDDSLGVESKLLPDMPEARFGPSPEIREHVSTLHPPADVDTGLLFCLQTAVRASVVLFQCPASFQTSRPNIENLSRFFQKIGPQPFRLAWEPCGPCQAEIVGDLCAQYRLIHCVDPKALVFVPIHGQ
jgi:hypothetical protein